RDATRGHARERAGGAPEPEGVGQGARVRARWPYRRRHRQTSRQRSRRVCEALRQARADHRLRDHPPERAVRRAPLPPAVDLWPPRGPGAGGGRGHRRVPRGAEKRQGWRALLPHHVHVPDALGARRAAAQGVLRQLPRVLAVRRLCQARYRKL
uniref:Uncharacterized protein n=1 Tax=Globisporangium ultimum (strain ATCC 200006 / CBS 805.95 / DAOM BR144) TaxID=431595 RepID=K3WFB1_GLOUD